MKKKVSRIEITECNVNGPLTAPRRLVPGVLAVMIALVCGVSGEPAFASDPGTAPPAAAAVPATKPAPDALAHAAPWSDELSAVREELAQQRELLQTLLAREPGQAPGAGAAPVTSAPSVPATDTAAPAGAVPPGGTVSGAQAQAPVASPEETQPASSDAAAPGASQAVPPSAPVTPAPVSQAPSAASAPAASSVPAAAPAAMTDDDRRAYASGVSLGRELQQSMAMQKSVGLNLSPALVLAGLEDSYGARPLRMDEDAIRQTLQGLNEEFTRRMQDRRADELAQGREYRQGFRKQKGVVADAGSLYQVHARGTGRLKTTDLATIEMTGTLPDGTVFDGSGQAGQARKVKVGSMLPAVAIGLQKIGVGGHVTVVVPPEKGYGDMGMPPAIPGGATLIFDITVKGVNEAG